MEKPLFTNFPFLHRFCFHLTVLGWNRPLSLASQDSPGMYASQLQEMGFSWVDSQNSPYLEVNPMMDPAIGSSWVELEPIRSSFVFFLRFQIHRIGRFIFQPGLSIAMCQRSSRKQSPSPWDLRRAPRRFRTSMCLATACRFRWLMPGSPL